MENRGSGLGCLKCTVDNLRRSDGKIFRHGRSMHRSRNGARNDDLAIVHGSYSGIQDLGSVSFSWSVSRLSLASQVSLKIIVVRSLSVKGFQCGRPFTLGSPVRAKAIQASLILPARARADSPSPVMRSQRAVLLKTKASSEQWKAMGRPLNMGVCHVN